MTNRAFDDREHRRGLVLGLTLAEVLLLLLFLLMLALFWRLSKVTDDLRETESQLRSVEAESKSLEIALSALGPLAAELKASGLSIESVNDLAHQLGELARLKQQVADLEGLNSSLTEQTRIIEILGEDPERIEDLARVVSDAAQIDPNDPPAVLRAGLELAKAVGDDQTVLQAIKLASERAEAIDPADPPEVLKEILEYGAAIVTTLTEASLEQMTPDEVAQAAIEAAQANGGPGEHDWPPIISLRDADGYTFQSGSAELSTAFRELLSGKVVTDLQAIVRRYDVDVVEVIGHTDEQRIAPRVSNLDEQLIAVFVAGVDVASLIPADNAGLGMARAAAVSKVLLADPRLSGLRILPLSGAQMIDNGDRLAAGGTGDVRERRRIEIRVRRSSEWGGGQSAVPG